MFIDDVAILAPSTFLLLLKKEKKKIHSKLHDIMLVVTKVHVILKSFIVLIWMHDKKGLV